MFLGIVAIGQVVALGVQSHAQPRYVFCATLILVLLGIDALERFGPLRLRALTLPLVIAAWLGVVITVPLYTRFLSEARQPLTAAAHAIRIDAAGRPCLVVAKAVTQLMWYSGCSEHLLRDFARVPPWTATPLDYVVSSRKITVQLGALLEAVPGIATSVTVDSSNAEVWRVAPASPER